MHLPCARHFLPGSLFRLSLALLAAGSSGRAAESAGGGTWRALPLMADGKVHPDWVHVGWGGFVVDGGALRTECDPRGLGLLVFRRERLGNCQLRVVFKSQEAKSNAGVYVRLADGILAQTKTPGAQFDRNAAGKISPESTERMKISAEREEGPWFAVHQGYEVQIMDRGDPLHRTGAIYSLAASSANTPRPGEWRTLLITLEGERILVELDGQRVTRFDPASPDLPPRKQWYEPKREPRRPVLGYLGLQNHDPGDVVWFREISVRPLP
jgi:hypothetical protein